MTLTTADLQSIKKALEPEFAKISGEFGRVNNKFDKVRSEAKKNFLTLNKKIENFRSSNRKDHNLIIDIFDKRDRKLQDRVAALESNVTGPVFKNL